MFSMTDRHHNDVVRSVTSPSVIPQESSSQMMERQQQNQPKTPAGHVQAAAAMIDKENAANQQRQTMEHFHYTPPTATATTPSFRSSSKKSVRIAPAVSSFQTPPGSAAAHGADGAYQSLEEGGSTYERQQTPLGSSKLLREQFQKVSLSTPTNNKRLIESGAVRLETPKSQSRLGGSKRHTPSSSRVGYDGTNHTPSDELLRSTASSRGHQIKTAQASSSSTKPKLTTDQFMEQQQQTQHRRQNSSDFSVMNETTDSSLDSSLARANMKGGYMSLNDDGYSVFGDSPFSQSHDDDDENNNSASSQPYHAQSPICRQGCANPVALTLLNNGSEDYEMMIQQNAAHGGAGTGSPTNGSTEQDQNLYSTISPISPIPPISTTTTTSMPTPPSSTSSTTSTEHNHHHDIPCSLAQTTNLRKVSSNLSDVKDEDDMATLVKPEPRRCQYSS